MIAHLVIAAVLASNAAGKTAVRGQPGTLVTGPLPFVQLMNDDPSTISHVRWNGSQMIPVVGAAWTMNGTVPQVAKSGKRPAGAGPYSDTNYYSVTQANPSADFSTCIAFIPASASFTVITDVGAVSGGYRIEHGLNLTVQMTAPGVDSVAAPVASVASAVNVLCAGRTGGTAAIKLNLGVYTTKAIAMAQGNGETRLGRSRGAGGAYPGTILEVWYASTTPSDALFTEIAQRVKLRAGITAW